MKIALSESCRNAWELRDLSTCKPLGFDLIGWIAIGAPALGAIFFIAKFFASWRVKRKSMYPIVHKSLTRSRFRNLCAAIQPLMNSNNLLFQEFGPNSGRGGGQYKILRHNIDVWKNTMPKIVEQNSKIKVLIENNSDTIPESYEQIFDFWLMHIAAFEAHLKDDTLDYREYQFPSIAAAIVNRYA